MSGPGADVSVRIAWADDAGAIAALQLAAWPERYAGVVPDRDLPLPDEALVEVGAAWRSALARPGDARQRVLVALERNRVVGFVICAPATDPDCDAVLDAELSELTVAAGERGRGHGSRLLQAAVDTLVADHFRRAVTWLAVDDDALRAFLGSAGWAPDTAHRELALDAGEAGSDVRLRQVRLHTALG